MDSTEAFSHNTQVEDEQVGEFVRNLAPVLSGRTNGYGLWVYRNYVNNAVYNSQFALEPGGLELFWRQPDRRSGRAPRRQSSGKRAPFPRIWMAGSPEAAGSMWNFTQKQKTAEPV